MKAGDFMEALERFFLDIIGTVLPGLAMVVGCCYITNHPIPDLSQLLIGRTSDYDWILLVGFSFILGHAITSLGYVMTKLLEHFFVSDAKEKANKKRAGFLSFVSPEKEVAKELNEDPIFKAFLQLLFKRVPPLAPEADKVKNPRTWRNMALSIAQDQSHLVYRFMFISLLNLGAATVSIFLCLLWVVLLTLQRFGVSVSVIDFNLLLIVFLAAPYLFLERYYSFNKMAIKVPFSMALAKLTDSSDKSSSRTNVPSDSLVTNRQRLRVYLAGGFRSGWQDKVMKAVDACDYFDPRMHGLKSKAEYTGWDLEAIKRSDIVFAYLETTNPGGYALALEVGYAKASGKFVILVDEKSGVDEQTRRYLEMITETSDVSLTTLQEGIGYLEKFRLLA